MIWESEVRVDDEGIRGRGSGGIDCRKPEGVGVRISGVDRWVKSVTNAGWINTSYILVRGESDVKDAQVV